MVAPNTIRGAEVVLDAMKITRPPKEGLLPPLVDIPQTAKAFGVSVKTVRRRIEDGTLPAVRFGPRCIRIRREDVLKLMTPPGAHDAPQAR